MKKVLITAVSLAIAFVSAAAFSAWDPNEVDDLHAKSQEALAAFKEKDSGVQNFVDKAAGYVVIPTVGKGGMGIGGARGKGLLYEGGAPTAVVTLTQISVGFQFGGQAYSEFIFFEDEATLNNFKGGNFRAECTGVGRGCHRRCVGGCESFDHGMAIFTQAKGGLMYEAAVGGQKFKVEMPK